MTERKLHSRRASRALLLAVALSIALAAPALHAQAGANTGSGAAQAQGGQPPAQNTPVQLPKFDVASIKPHKSEGMTMRWGSRLTPDGISIAGTTLFILLREAFAVQADRIRNAPEWVKSDHYDIEAKVDPDDAPKLKDLTMEQRYAMLVPLLEDRFGLKFHHETMDLEVYDLVAAKGGLKLQPAKQDVTGPDGKPMMGRAMIMFSPQGMKIVAYGSKAEAIAGILSSQLGSLVVDKTGLTGTYDYTLTFAPEMGAGSIMGMPPGAPPPGGDASPPQPTGPSLFAALQEQLGLKLEAHKEPVGVIVIDHIEQPSPN